MPTAALTTVPSPAVHLVTWSRRGCVPNFPRGARGTGTSPCLSRATEPLYQACDLCKQKESELKGSAVRTLCSAWGLGRGSVNGQVVGKGPNPREQEHPQYATQGLAKNAAGEGPRGPGSARRRPPERRARHLGGRRTSRWGPLLWLAKQGLESLREIPQTTVSCPRPEVAVEAAPGERPAQRRAASR